ncbi:MULTISPECIES: D-arabinono-1,4-lactone oxidase [unclassified Mesorhizobium]|uniref:D-arabinono-1,4-lactone oxidase n=1 Tax=unclassified Mesorhizobium TaxID=325217 RepID=UPI003335506C
MSNQVCRVKHFEMPSSDDDVCSTIKAAALNNLRIRVVGTGHSYTPIVPTDGVLISAERLSGIENIDHANGRVTLRGGTRICDVGSELRSAGWALPNQGDIDLQTISGAVSTGTHGSGDSLKCLAGPIVGMRIATGDGSIVNIDASQDADALNAAKVSIGMFGVVLSVTMKLVPAFDLHDKIWREDFEECMDHLDQLCQQNRSLRVFWCPTEHSASLYSLPNTFGMGRTRSKSDVCELRTLNVTAQSPESVEDRVGERIGPSYRIFPGSIPMPNHNECEYAVAYGDGPSVFREIRKLIKTKYPSQIFPVEYRTVAADDIWLSPYFERKTAMISVSGAAGEDYWDFIRDCETIFSSANGRPHWGKLHSLGRPEIEGLYPRYRDFVSQRARFDPDGRFLNDYLRERFG